MQFRLLALSSAFAIAMIAPTSYAVECTKAQHDELDKLEDDSGMDKLCPDDTDDVFDFDDVDSDDWMKVSPCKNPTCVTYLKGQAAKVPDCTHHNFNMKDLYAAKLTLCMDLANGTLSSDEMKKRISTFMANWDYDDSDSDDNHHNHRQGTQNSTTPSSSTNSSTPSSSTISNTPTSSVSSTVTNSNITPAPTPTPSPTKSNAMSVTMASSAAVVAAALSVLL